MDSALSKLLYYNIIQAQADVIFSTKRPDTLRIADELGLNSIESVRGTLQENNNF